MVIGGLILIFKEVNSFKIGFFMSIILFLEKYVIIYMLILILLCIVVK